jgi:hypothetical protein
MIQMSESRPIYGINSSLASFPEPIQAALHLIESQPASDAAAIMAHFVAAIVHPDFVCNVAAFAHLHSEVKQQALQVFKHCVVDGLSADERADVLRWLTPYLTRLGTQAE